MPGPAMSAANEPAAAHAGRPRADGAASGSRHPSTTTPGATASAVTPHARRSARSASSPQAENHRTLRQVGTTYLPRYPHAAPSRRREKYICPGGIRFRHAQVQGGHGRSSLHMGAAPVQLPGLRSWTPKRPLQPGPAQIRQPAPYPDPGTPAGPDQPRAAPGYGARREHPPPAAARHEPR